MNKYILSSNDLFYWYEWLKLLNVANWGFVSFISKTKLVEHYNKTLGAVNVFDQRMVIKPREALKLIKKYFPDLK